MERALLERMIGAVVLVLMLVLLAPALLDGRDAGDSDGYLADRDAEPGTTTQVIVLNAPVNAPAPQPVESVIAIQPAAGSNVPEPQESRKEPPQGYAVQVNAFSDRRNAERYAAEVKGAGFSVFVIRGESTAGELYRVYSGPVESRDQAGSLASRLRGKGYKGIVVELGKNGRG